MKLIPTGMTSGDVTSAAADNLQLLAELARSGAITVEQLAALTPTVSAGGAQEWLQGISALQPLKQASPDVYQAAVTELLRPVLSASPPNPQMQWGK